MEAISGKRMKRCAPTDNSADRRFVRKMRQNNAILCFFVMA